MAETLKGYDLPLPILLLKAASEKVLEDDELKKWLFSRLKGSPNDRIELLEQLLDALQIFAKLEDYLEL